MSEDSNAPFDLSDKFEDILDFVRTAGESGDVPDIRKWVRARLDNADRPVLPKTRRQELTEEAKTVGHQQKKQHAKRAIRLVKAKRPTDDQLLWECAHAYGDSVAYYLSLLLEEDTFHGIPYNVLYYCGKILSRHKRTTETALKIQKYLEEFRREQP